MEIETTKNAVNTRILKNARKSPQYISEVVLKGTLTPEEVAERITTLLKDDDWLSIRQQELLLLHEVNDLKDLALERLENTDDRNFAGMVNAVKGLMKMIQETLESRKRTVQIDVDRITEANARKFGQAFDVALRHLVDGLKFNHPEITDEEAYRLVREGLSLAKDSLEESIG